MLIQRGGFGMKTPLPTIHVPHCLGHICRDYMYYVQYHMSTTFEKLSHSEGSTALAEY